MGPLLRKKNAYILRAYSHIRTYNRYMHIYELVGVVLRFQKCVSVYTFVGANLIILSHQYYSSCSCWGILHLIG
jgi:hypothetical protein